LDDTDGNRVDTGNVAARWNILINTINLIRSCAGSGGEVIPWVSTPTFSGDADEGGADYDLDPWWGLQLYKHCWASGVKEFLYWNSTSNANQSSDDATAVEYFQSLSSIPVGGSTKEIPLDSTEIVTGSVTTTLAEANKHL
jgi:hypothetical protein